MLRLLINILFSGVHLGQTMYNEYGLYDADVVGEKVSP